MPALRAKSDVIDATTGLDDAVLAAVVAEKVASAVGPVPPEHPEAVADRKAEANAEADRPVADQARTGEVTVVVVLIEVIAGMTADASNVRFHRLW
jgi:hypothetical protein